MGIVKGLGRINTRVWGWSHHICSLNAGAGSAAEVGARAIGRTSATGATGTASDGYSAGSEAEGRPAPRRRRSAKMRRSGGAPHVR